MKKATLVLILFLIITKTGAQTFGQFLSRINALPEYQRQAVADSFINAVQVYPFCESDTLVHFIFTGNAQSVAIAGDQTVWSPTLGLARITGTTFWYYTAPYASDARIDYKMVTDGSNWILDPRNPKTCLGGYGPNSELRMPGNQAPPEVFYYAVIPHGTLRDTTFHSTNLGNDRAVKIYLPSGYPWTQSTYPVIVFHDGLDYINLAAARNVLDYLIANQQITPVIGIFVPPVDRSSEYAGARIDLFTAFITDELMPVIDMKYKTSRDPRKRAMLGASDGGNISLYIGMKHPEQFGCIAAHSSDVIPVISNTFLNGPKLNLNIYLDIGTYDIPVLIPMVNNLAGILKAKEYNYYFAEVHEGHSWGNWKEHMRIPLIRFFHFMNGINENQNQPAIQLEQNRPNPFRRNTVIPFRVPEGSHFELSLCDASGKFLETIDQSNHANSANIVTFTNRDYPSGNYFCILNSAGNIATRVITIIR